MSYQPDRREFPRTAPSQRRPRPAPRRRLHPEVLSHAEAVALIASCGTRQPTALRNRALIAIFYRSGLRISEALQLSPKDLDLEHGMVRVLFGKGGKSRTVGIDGQAAAIVGEWLAVRSAWAGPISLHPRSPLFCTKSGRGLTGAYVRRLLPELARKAGIAKRVHAHGLRHTHAAELRCEGVDIGLISKQLGHSSITTTARYLEHIAPMAIVEAVRTREW